MNFLHPKELNIYNIIHSMYTIKILVPVTLLPTVYFLKDLSPSHLEELGKHHKIIKKFSLLETR